MNIEQAKMYAFLTYSLMYFQSGFYLVVKHKLNIYLDLEDLEPDRDLDLNINIYFINKFPIT